MFRCNYVEISKYFEQLFGIVFHLGQNILQIITRLYHFDMIGTQRKKKHEYMWSCVTKPAICRLDK